MTDMIAAYSVKPKVVNTGAEVLDLAAKVRAFRRASQAKPIPPAPKQPGILECGVWPAWVNDFVHGQPLPVEQTNVIEVSFPVVKPFAVYRTHPHITDIVRIVARFYQVSTVDIYSQRRTASIVRPRQIACYLCKTMTLKSLPEIGRRLGGKDHTTILHAVRKIEGLRGIDDRLADEIALLRMKISDHLAKHNPAE